MPRTRDLASALAREFSAVAASLLGADAGCAPADLAGEPRWVVRIIVGGQAFGSIFIAFGDDDAKRLARTVMGLDADPPDAAVADTVLELSGQAASALGQSDDGVGLTFSTEAATPGDLPVAPRAGFSMELGEWSGVLLVAGEARVPDEASEPAAAPEPARGFAPPPPAPMPMPVVSAAPPNLDVILDIDLPIAVRFGATDMPLQALTRLGPGSIIDLERSPDDPVEVLISGKVVARGEVVVVAGNYGVRITEVVSTADRIRSMGA